MHRRAPDDAALGAPKSPMEGLAMRSIKATAIILVLGIVIATGIYISRKGIADAAAAAENAGIYPQQTIDPNLSARLIRFGQVAYNRRQYLEAKHFFQKAIIADPSNATAWKKYNSALLSLISEKVASDPIFLPDMESQSGRPAASQPKPAKTAPADDGC